MTRVSKEYKPFFAFQKFPNDGLGTVVRNVFDFDSYSKETREVLTEVLHKHGK